MYFAFYELTISKPRNIFTCSNHYMSQLKRVTSTDPGFQTLVALLDKELAIRDGNEHSFYAQFNKIDALKNVVLYSVGDSPVGCGAFKPYDGTTVEIKRMFVLPEYRGKRIAAEILYELEQWAAQQNYTSCILETGKKQPEAIALYQRSGYQIIPNYGQYAGVENSVCMKKAI
jgi:putative acetyltransferase